MNICGVLVHANPARLPVVLEGLQGLDGVEVHDLADAGRIVVTVEDTEQTTALDTLSKIHRLDGIVAAALVYHYCEPAEPGLESREEAQRP